MRREEISQLFEKYDHWFTAALSILKNPEQAQEVTQEVFIKAFQQQRASMVAAR